MSAEVLSIDPRTGEVVEVVAHETASVSEICDAALAAAGPLEALGRDKRAALLEALAVALEDSRPRIVEVADRETGLGETRLNGELTRTCYQLRLFASVLTDGGYLEAAIDHAGDTAMGPRPDLRRMLIPVGPVAVFGASNFPLAFSVPGGDTASAIAAGCRSSSRHIRRIRPPPSCASTCSAMPPARRAHRRAPSGSCTGSRPAPTWWRTRQSGRWGSPGRGAEPGR